MITLEFSKTDIFNLALAVSAAASSSYIDERLSTSATEHSLAAKLWNKAGNQTLATRHSWLAQSIGQEMIELAAGEED